MKDGVPNGMKVCRQIYKRKQSNPKTILRELHDIQDQIVALSADASHFEQKIDSKYRGEFETIVRNKIKEEYGWCDPDVMADKHFFEGSGRLTQGEKNEASEEETLRFLDTLK